MLGFRTLSRTTMALQYRITRTSMHPQARMVHIASGSAPRKPHLRPSLPLLRHVPGVAHRNQRVRWTQCVHAQQVQYDATRNAEVWQVRPVPVVSRLLQIGFEFSRWGLQSQIHKSREKSAAQMREVLTRLGPAFVKIGQALSSRPDILPPDYLRELEKLQDRIPPFDNVQAFAVIEAELQQPLADVFSEISQDPVAAASLGQVYKARLRGSGQEVAVKVQRPGVMNMISMDVYILRELANLLRKVRQLNTDVAKLVDEWASSLFLELDYTREAANGIRFKELFSHMDEIFVPTMYTGLTTPKVLVMEWVDGERMKADDMGPGAPRVTSGDWLKLVEAGVECSLEQMLNEGFYHADPHPGNLLRTSDGKLCYLDFGMMGSIDLTIRQALIRATLHLVNREYEALAQDFITLGLLPPGSDRNEVVPALTGVFQEALKGGVSNLSFGDLSYNLGQTMYQFKFRIPPYYTLLVRSLTVLEGIALNNDPNYKVLGAAYPWVARRLLTDQSMELRQTLNSLLYKNGRFQFSRLESLLQEAVKSPGAPSTAVAAANPSKGGRGTAVQLLLSDNGRFVRDILLDELAKGVDAAWRLAYDSAVTNARSQLASPPFALPDMPLAEVNQGTVLLEGLMRLPALADEDDKRQVDGITRLATTLVQISNRNGSSSQSSMSGSAWSIDQSAEALRWLATEIQALPSPAREEALRLPLQLAGKLSSRIAARAIRTALGSSSTRAAVVQVNMQQ